MSSAQIEIQLIAIITALSCALPGVFLVLRRMAMMSDAISHSILFGIVLAFFVVKDLASPILLVAAAATGVLTVALVELLNKSKLLKEDASIGIVFPVLFSIGVILITRFAGSVHLDVDAVLLGELAFAPFDRMIILGNDVGPKSLWIMSSALLLNVTYLLFFYRQLKISTFDPGLAAALGISPAIIHYTHMTLVSLTAVGAFEAVGSILVVALMIAPAAAAYLLTDRLHNMILLASLIGIASAISGYWMAHLLDVSIAGSMATMTGVFFLLSLFVAPGRGLIALSMRRRRQKWEFSVKLLVVHLSQHEGSADESYESGVANLEDHFRWDANFAWDVISHAQKSDYLTEEDGLLKLTSDGREYASISVTT